MRGIKKLISLFLAMIIMFNFGVVSNVEATASTETNTTVVEQSPLFSTVSANAYVVMDANSGEIIMSQDADKRIYPASTTKLLTAVVAVENCDIHKKILVTQEALNNVDAQSSIAGIKAGSSYTMEELLYMLLVVSAADAAEVIAEEVGKTNEHFVDMMNEKAQQIGMTNSYFDNAVGMDWHINCNIYSTANDIAKLTRYAMTNYTIRKIVRHSSYTINNFNNGQSKTFSSTNGFLRHRKYANNLFTVIGSKTGTTDKAGYALTTTAKDSSGREVICAFFGAKTRGKMYKDINRLLINAFKNNKDKLETGILNLKFPSVNYVMDEQIEEEIALGG